MDSQRVCVLCGKLLMTRFQVKYCSNKCQMNGRYNQSLQKWKMGLKSGSVGIKTKILSATVRRYLMEKNNNCCTICGWNKIHPITGVVPLEVDHIDGNSDNNKESNLRLICPNCHSLTPHFRNLNKGKGRKWRLNK